MNLSGCTPKATTGAAAGRAETGIGEVFFSMLRRILGGLAAAVLFGIMAMTFCDVVGRYLFGAPLAGTYEVTQVGLGILIFAALPLVTERAEHVEIDLVDRLLTPRARHRLSVVLAFAGALVLFGVAAVIWRQGSKVSADGLLTEALGIPLGPVVQFMAVCSALSGLVLMRRVWVLPAGPEASPGRTGDDHG